MNEPLVDKGLNDNRFIVSTTDLCEILDLSPRRIQQLTKDNALVRISRGKYDLPESIRAFIEYSTDKPDEELNKTTEEALWTRARRQKAELDLQIMKGELHRSDDVERVMNNMLSVFRTRVLAIPSKVSHRVVGETEIAVVKGIIKEAVIDCLAVLSDYDPHVFYAESKDKVSLDEEDDSDLAGDNNDKGKVNGHSKKKK